MTPPDVSAQSTTIVCRAHRRVVRDIERMMCGALSHARHARLRDHLRGCSMCEAYYERARRAEEALVGSEALSDEAIARMASLTVPFEAPPLSPMRAWGAWLGAGTAVAALAVALLVVLPGGDDTLTPRGLATEPSRAGIRVFRVVPEREQVEWLQGKQGEVRVANGEILQLAYRNHDYRFAVVVGVDDTRQTQWYHPAARPLERGGVPLSVDVDDAPFGQAYRLDSGAARIRLFALFGDEPFDAAEIERAMASITSAEAGVVGATRLDVPAAFQDTVLLSVQR